MKSKSLLETVTFDDGLVGKIDPNIVIDRLIHTKFGAIAWDSLTTSRLNPNDRNDLHFVITKSGEIVLDTFTGKGIRYYNKALTTRVGLFRWYDYVTSEDGGAVGNSDLRPKEYNIDSDGFNTGWIYLTPNGGGKIIKINPGVGKYVYRMWDTPFGVFMSVRNYRYYGLSAVEYWSFKQMIAVPVDDTKEISIEDEQYFKELNCNELKILDCCNTQKGLFAVGHSNNKWVTLRYNGDDFYVVDDTARIVSIIDTTVDTLFLTNVDNEAVYSYNNNTDALAVNNNFNIGNVELSNNKFGQKREDIETIFGPQICVKGGVWNLALKQKINFVDSNGKGPAALQKIRIYIDNESDNLPVIAEYLADKGLPLDVDIKCIGSIMYNGLQVLINGLQIISENGLSKKPQTVKFYIDKNARFTRNRESIEALFGPDENTWETNIKDIGLISDYDPVTEEYYNIPCQISKMNFMVLYE